MAQSDTFTAGDSASVGSNATDTVDVTAASGVEVAVSALGIGGEVLGNGEGVATHRDTGGNENWLSGSISDPKGGLAGFGGGSGQGKYNAGTHLDDTIGIRFIWEDTSGSGGSRAHYLTGVESQ